MIDKKNCPDQEKVKHPEYKLADQREKELFQFLEFCGKFIDKADNLS